VTGRRLPETITREEYRIALEATRPEFRPTNEKVFALLVGRAERGLTPRALTKAMGWKKDSRANLAVGDLAKAIQRALPPLKLPRDPKDDSPLQFAAICEFDEVKGGVPWVLRRSLLEAVSDTEARPEPLDQEDPFDDSPQAYAREGEMKFRTHKYYERKPGRRRDKLASVLAATGRLACEICDSDCRERYGPDPRFCFEVHHRLPLSELRGPMDVHLDDLAVLCVLCHRFIHSLPVLPSVEEARTLLAARSS
jgi:predicted HNH restriction endonuclease